MSKKGGRDTDKSFYNCHTPENFQYCHSPTSWVPRCTQCEALKMAQRLALPSTYPLYNTTPLLRSTVVPHLGVAE